MQFSPVSSSRLTPNIRLSVRAAGKVNSEQPVFTLAVTVMAAARLPATVRRKDVRIACRKGLGQRPFTPSVRRRLPSHSELRKLGRLVAVIWSQKNKKQQHHQHDCHFIIV